MLITSTAMIEEATDLRARSVLLVAREQPQNVNITIGDVSKIVAGCVRMPLHKMRTTCHHPEDFMIIFDHPHQRTLALCIGGVRVKGVLFSTIPWFEHTHGRDITFWYHVRIAIENLSCHAWKLNALKEIPGEVCLFDKIDRATFR